MIKVIENMDQKLLEIERKSLIIRKAFETSKLIEKYPPKIKSTNKKIIYDIACPINSNHHGELIFSKWSQIDCLDVKFKVKSSTAKLIMEENAYQYNPNQFPKPNDIEWYVNFADERLFFGYSTDLFAQDEIQVAEHPSLGSLREYLIAIEKEDKIFRPYTRDENSNPTPVLIRGIERRLKISVEPNIEDGRPFSLYGNNFRRADKDMLRNACRVISPPTITNLIAMEAPKYGSGPYSIDQVLDVFTTAFTAFTAAKIESLHEINESPNIIIHTGNWGCGVFGGNKTLMALLQIISAQIVGIKYLIYHTYDPESTNDYKGAIKLFNSLLMEENKELRINDILTKIQKFGFRWNVPNGN